MSGKPRYGLRSSLTVALSLFLLAVCSCSRQWGMLAFRPEPTGKAKNIILFIGDGMGFEQVEAAGMYWTGSSGTLSFESFPHHGAVRILNAEGGVTDSAASATAVTGVKDGPGALPAVTWSTTGHTTREVPIYGWGKNAEQIAGSMENTDVFRILMQSLPRSYPADRR